MAPLRSRSTETRMFETLNSAIIGYTLNVVGLFFLAAAITFKKPRREIEEILGVERPRSMSGVRDHLVNQIQVYIAFVFLVAGYVLLMGDALTRDNGGEPLAQSNNLPLIAIVLFVSTIVTMVVLKVVQLIFTRYKFRRMLAEVLRESRYPLDRDQKLAVQIGELLQIPQTREESVPEYIEKVKATLGLDSAPASESLKRVSRRLPRVAAPPRG